MAQQDTVIDRLINEGVPSAEHSSLLFHQVFAQTAQTETVKAAPLDTAQDKPFTPPPDLSDHEKAMASFIDPAATIGGSSFWLAQLSGRESKSLATDLKGLQRVSDSPVSKEFFKDAPRFAERVEANAKLQLEKLYDFQKARPDLFTEFKNSDGSIARQPKLNLMSEAEKETVFRSWDWTRFSGHFAKIKAIEDRDTFDVALKGIKELGGDSAAKMRGLAPGASKLESLGLELEQILSLDASVKHKALEAFKGKNIAAVLSGIAADAAIEHYILPGSAPGRLTVAADALSPAVIFTPLSPVAKAATIVAAHGAARAADYLFSSIDK